MTEQFLEVRYDAPKWRIVCQALGGMVIFENESKDVCNDQLDFYTRLITAHGKWTKKVRSDERKAKRDEFASSAKSGLADTS